MNEKEIKSISKKSMVKAPHDFTDRLMYRIENEAHLRKPVQIPIPFMVIGALAFIGIMVWITLSLPEVNASGSSLINKLTKRGFQVVMAVFFLSATYFLIRLKKQSN
jgi:hypothetical protein